MLLKIIFQSPPRSDVRGQSPPIWGHVSMSAHHLGQSAREASRKWNRAREPGGAARCYGNGRQDGERERGRGDREEPGTGGGTRGAGPWGERDRENGERDWGRQGECQRDQG